MHDLQDACDAVQDHRSELWGWLLALFVFRKGQCRVEDLQASLLRWTQTMTRMRNFHASSHFTSTGTDPFPDKQTPGQATNQNNEQRRNGNTSTPNQTAAFASFHSSFSYQGHLTGVIENSMSCAL
eukprot:scaffold1207_cov170-Alexandrium_tamarense.AAC.3